MFTSRLNAAVLIGPERREDLAVVVVVNVDILALVRTRLLKTGETGIVSGGLMTLGMPESPALVNTLGSIGLARNPFPRLARMDSRSFKERYL
jgi:hypothetical protein